MTIDYWVQREHNHTERLKYQSLNDAKAFRLFSENAMREIEKLINDLLLRYANKESIAMADAQERTAKFDVEAFRDKAKKYVQTRNFSDKANRELRLYNMKMRLSRLQLLKNEIAIELSKYSDLSEQYMRQRLTEFARTEIERQSGILAGTVRFSKDATTKIINGSFKNVSFSMIWGKDMAQIQALLEKTLDNAITRGENPKKMISEVREKFVNVSHKQASRLLITETAHVQTQIQLHAFKQAGYTKVRFIAEPGACSTCSQYADQVFLIEELLAKPPLHPYCRCSLIPEP
ncbi:minor capsid protein [Listeria fleischmannii]|uniref:Phage head morphogenesis domain-containing protein n=1 Tax=Listeria fleischmannii FSL S10-1203 TaxID=1265822 RepID=W7DQG0_9LIST|nr:minor capsid protein [Listeria fleischmannii]EUJ64732.1 hypothetical protein MCOL2_00920 [Listeria fleischmannii FSL S10-1203]